MTLPGTAAEPLAGAATRPVRCAVAVVVRDPQRPDHYLAVRRPDDDPSLPGLWGLPAVTLAPGELPEAGVGRVGREKLGADLIPVRFVGIASADRGDYQLILMDIEARPTDPPDVHRATTSATRYVDQRWTDDLHLLAAAARRGSLCSRILLDAAGVAF